MERETSQVLNIANTYIKIVTKNNECILEILRNNYSYIEPEDIDVFQQFIVDYTRLKAEIDDSGSLSTPLSIYHHIGSISFMRAEFINHIREKFNTKKKELDSLMS